MTVKQLRDLLEEYGDDVVVKLEAGDGERELDLDHHNLALNSDGDLVISL